MFGKQLANFLFIIIFTLGFLVKLYKIDSPIADWHSWRQADTAAVARNFEKQGFTPFIPKYDDLSNVQTGKDNPLGLRMVEFPIYQSIGYFLHKAIPFLSLEIILRFVSIVFSQLSIVCLYLLVKRYFGFAAAFFSSCVFSFLPFSIYYSRTILPESTAVGLAILSLFLLDTFKQNRRIILFLLSSISFALSILVKPTAGFLLLPAIYIFWQIYGAKCLKKAWIYIFFFLGVAPFMTWRLWISNFPEGIPSYLWLLNGEGVRFSPSYFRWLVAERLGKLILGYTGLYFFINGLTEIKIQKRNLIFEFIGLGTLLYLLIFARGNLQHDYYQILIIPAVSFYTGMGMAKLFERLNFWRFGLLLSCTLSMFLLSWYEVKGYYWINHPEIIQAGKATDQITPKNAKVIAPYNGDTAFLYQTNRLGWPVVNKPINEMVKDGASYLVIVNPDQDALNLGNTYNIIKKEEKYVIFKLSQTQ